MNSIRPITENRAGKGFCKQVAIIISFLFFILNQLPAQTPEVSLDKSILVKSIEPADEDFSDLLPLIEKIGPAKVVALGESTHEDGATFKAKARLVMFLHEKMGFDVLLWESGMLDNWNMNALLRSNCPMTEAISYERGRWGFSQYSGPVFDYARQSWKTNHPLETGGFDFGGASTGAQTSLSLLNYAIREVPALQPGQEEWTAIDSLLRGYLSYASAKNSIAKKMSAVNRELGIASIKKIIRQAETSKTEFLKVMSASEFGFMLYLLNNIIKDLDVNLLFMANYIGSTYDGLTWNSKRDADMADRVLWMSNNIYKDRKIILWGASAHFMRNSKGFLSRDGRAAKWNYYQMGDYIAKELKKDYYVVAFTSFGGTRGDIYPDKKMNDEYGSLENVQEKAAGSFEQVAHQFGKPYLFVDLRSLPENHWLRKPAVAYAFGNTKDETDWSTMIDGFFFIDTMEPDKKK
jgi:erythromycin esterase